MSKIKTFLKSFTKDYLSRHKHSINMLLHIIGIPIVIIGILQLFNHKWEIGLFYFFMGYLLQWIGHVRFEKNELGELLLIKKLLRKRT